MRPTSVGTPVPAPCATCGQRVFFISTMAAWCDRFTTYDAGGVAPKVAYTRHACKGAK